MAHLRRVDTIPWRKALPPAAPRYGGTWALLTCPACDGEGLCDCQLGVEDGRCSECEEAESTACRRCSGDGTVDADPCHDCGHYIADGTECGECFPCDACDRGTHEQASYDAFCWQCAPRHAHPADAGVVARLVDRCGTTTGGAA